MEVGKRESPYWEVLDITRGYAGRIKTGFHEGSWMVLSDGYFEVTLVFNIEGAGPGEGDTLSNL